MKRLILMMGILASTAIAQADVDYCGRDNRFKSAGEVMLKSLMVEAVGNYEVEVLKTKSEKAVCYQVAKLSQAVDAPEFRQIYNCGDEEAQEVWDIVFRTADLVDFCDVGLDVPGVTERTVKTVQQAIDMARLIREMADSLSHPQVPTP